MCLRLHVRLSVCIWANVWEREKEEGWGVGGERKESPMHETWLSPNRCYSVVDVQTTGVVVAVLFLDIILPLCIFSWNKELQSFFFIIFLLMEFMDMTFENFTDLTKKLKTYLSTFSERLQKRELWRNSVYSEGVVSLSSAGTWVA